jgi:hypothetical protein
MVSIRSGRTNETAQAFVAVLRRKQRHIYEGYVLHGRHRADSIRHFCVASQRIRERSNQMSKHASPTVTQQCDLHKVPAHDGRPNNRTWKRDPPQRCANYAFRWPWTHKWLLWTTRRHPTETSTASVEVWVSAIAPFGNSLMQIRCVTLPLLLDLCCSEVPETIDLELHHIAMRRR